MSDYFDRVEQGMREAVRRRAHMPWYARLLAIGRPRTLVVVLAALVVASPAVGAATDWFGIGAPDRLPSQSQFVGRPVPGTSRLLGLRVADPQGGPPWALRLVRTTRGDACIQLGRIENGTLGSLGIDYAWNNDHLFHPFPSTSIGDTCGTTDAAGDGFVNVAYTGLPASADPTAGARYGQAESCRALPQGRPDMPLCAPGSTRMIFMGLLGPDATSITYLAPDGTLKTEPTSGGDGAYLLVFTRDQTTCNLYTHGQFGSYGPCGGGESLSGASPDPIGAVKAVSYRDGHKCGLVAPAKLLAAFRAFARKFRSQYGSEPHSQATRRAAERALAGFLASEHLTRNGWRSVLRPNCPPVGYVAQTQKPVTAGQVATPITVRMISSRYWCGKRGPFVPNTFSWIPCDRAVPRGYVRIHATVPDRPVILVNVSLTARLPVTSSHSWYEISITNGCNSGGVGAELGFGNIRAGQTLRFQNFAELSCKGVYRGSVGYVQNSGPINKESAGGGGESLGGSVIVGRFSFTIR